MTDERCGNCHYGRHAIDPSGTVDLKNLMCKYKEPPLFPMQTPQGLMFVSPRPTMAAADWCGKWEAKR